MLKRGYRPPAACWLLGCLLLSLAGTGGLAASTLNLTKEKYSGRVNIYPRWIDQDAHLLFLSKRTHQEFAIWMMDVETQIGRQLTFNPAWVGQFAWDQSRRYLVYVARLRAVDEPDDDNYELLRLDLG